MKAVYLPMTVQISPGEDDEGGFVSYCPELDIASQGESVEEAAENLRDAVIEYIDALREQGNLQTVLDSRGLEVMPEEPGVARVEVGPGEFVSRLVATFEGDKVSA
jgi:predicted RNase H-like HicB family nuclease